MHIPGQSTNMANSVEESTISEKEVMEDIEVALEKNCQKEKNWSQLWIFRLILGFGTQQLDF